jgi:hypothetical protein
MLCATEESQRWLRCLDCDLVYQVWSKPHRHSGQETFARNFCPQCGSIELVDENEAGEDDDLEDQRGNAPSSE